MSKEETIFGDDWPYSKAKSALLRSAAVVMRERGPRSATLKNIAGKAGVTEPAIFRHFDGVDGVFISLFAVSELFYGKFVESFKDAEYTGLDRFEASMDRIFAILRDYPDFAYIIAKPDPIYRQYPKLKAMVEKLDASLRAAVLDCLKEAKSAGQLVPTVEQEPFASALIGALFQVMYTWLENVEGYDPRKEGKKIVTALLALARKPGLESKVVKTATAKPATAKPAAAKASAVKPATAKTSAEKPSAAKPVTAKPTAEKSKAAKAAKPVKTTKK